MTRSADGMLYLRDGRIGLDGTALQGDLDLALDGARPKLTGRLVAGDLGFGADTGAKATAQGGSGQGGTDQGWSDDPLPAAGLRAVDAELGLTVDTLRLGPMRLSQVQTRITVDSGRAVADLSRAAAYGGALSGQIVVNGRKGLSAAARLALKGVDLQPLLTDAAGFDRLVGKGDLAVDLVAGGGSVAKLMRGLDGSGQLALGAGEIRGLDIPALLATLNASDMGPESRTVFDALDASFTIRKGQLQNDDLALQSPYLRAKGDGRIGIAPRDIDYRLRATALRGADGQDTITLPILITGHWSDTTVALDLEAIARDKLGDKAKAAEAEVKRRAARELGAQDGETLEDAAKRRLQEELGTGATDALQQLLGGN